jgi:hypothetical protein
VNADSGILMEHPQWTMIFVLSCLVCLEDGCPSLVKLASRESRLILKAWIAYESLVLLDPILIMLKNPSADLRFKAKLFHEPRISIHPKITHYSNFLL